MNWVQNASNNAEAISHTDKTSNSFNNDHKSGSEVYTV